MLLWMARAAHIWDFFFLLVSLYVWHRVLDDHPRIRRRLVSTIDLRMPHENEMNTRLRKVYDGEMGPGGWMDWGLQLSAGREVQEDQSSGIQSSDPTASFHLEPLTT